MRRKKYALVVCLLLLALCCIPAAAAAEETPEPLTILFTHDTHDHFDPDAAGRGGYARLATLLKEQRAAAEGPVITVDAGDFSMGSLFQTIYASDAPELRVLGAMGCDVTTFGNHEFDYRQEGLASMLEHARRSGDPLPALVQCNYKTPLDPANSTALVQAMEHYPVTDYTVLERDGLRIAVFGLLGEDADACAPMSEMQFEPIEESAKRVVAEIQEKEHPDYVVCLSHTGTEDGKGEDYELAEAVDGIDVIISGHTHSTLETPIQVNDTILVSCGEYTKNLGRLVVGKEETGAVELKEYDLFPVDDTVQADPEIAELTQRFRQKVDDTYLKQYHLQFHQELTHADGDFTVEGTGNLIGAAYRWAVQQVEGPDSEPVAFAVAPDGVIRDVLREGPVTTAQAFDILSLGSGADGTPAYPLVSVYLTGADLRNACEVDASVSALMPAAKIYGDGVCWTWNPRRMFLDRVVDCGLMGPDGETLPIEEDRLYRVVADLYTGQMLGAVADKSLNLLSVTPRDADGNPVVNLEDYILHNADGSELKAWYALAAYLDEQEHITPPNQAELESHKLEDAEGSVLRNPGPATLAAEAAVLVLLALVVGAVLLVHWRRQRKRRTHDTTENEA